MFTGKMKVMYTAAFRKAAEDPDIARSVGMRRIHQMMPLLLHTEERRLRQDAQALMIE